MEPITQLFYSNLRPNGCCKSPNFPYLSGKLWSKFGVDFTDPMSFMNWAAGVLAIVVDYLEVVSSNHGTGSCADHLLVVKLPWLRKTLLNGIDDPLI